MTAHTAATFAKSLASYQKAFNKVFEICPRVDLSGGGNPVVDPLSGKIRPVWNDYNKILPYVDKISCKAEPLLDWGDRPKIIQKNDWLYKNHFFSTYLSVSFPYFVYTEEAGKHVKDEYHLTLYIDAIKFGIIDFETRYDKVLHQFDKCPSGIMRVYITEVEKAKQHVIEWRQALKNLVTA